MSKGTIRGIGLVLVALLTAALILTFTNLAQAEDGTESARSCISSKTDSTMITQCDDGTVTVVNQLTNTVMVCNSAKSADGTPKCTTQTLARSN